MDKIKSCTVSNFMTQKKYVCKILLPHFEEKRFHFLKIYICFMKTLINYAGSRPYYIETIKASFSVLFSLSYKSHVASIIILTTTSMFLCFLYGITSYVTGINACSETSRLRVLTLVSLTHARPAALI